MKIAVNSYLFIIYLLSIAFFTTDLAFPQLQTIPNKILYTFIVKDERLFTLRAKCCVPIFGRTL